MRDNTEKVMHRGNKLVSSVESITVIMPITRINDENSQRGRHRRDFAEEDIIIECKGYSKPGTTECAGG
jgi:hypothetical protein